MHSYYLRRYAGTASTSYADRIRVCRPEIGRDGGRASEEIDSKRARANLCGSIWAADQICRSEESSHIPSQEVRQIDTALFEAPTLMLASIASKFYSSHNNIQNLSEAEADATTGTSCEDGQEKKTGATISTLSTQPSQVGSPYLPVSSSSLVQPKAQNLTRHTHEQSHADRLGVMRLATSDAVDFLHHTSCLFRYVTIR